MRLLLVLCVLGIIAYIMLTKKKKESRKDSEEVDEREEEHAEKKEEDAERPYDTIIVCPVCLGTGEVLRIGNRRKRPDYYELKGKYEYYKKDDLYHYTTYCYSKNLSQDQQDELFRYHSEGEAYNENSTAHIATCPFCGERRTAYAWFEISAHSTQTIAGKTCSIPEKERVHVKTHHGKDVYNREPETRLVNFQPGGMNRDTFQFKWQYIGQDPRGPARFCVEITSENREFFANAKPRA